MPRTKDDLDRGIKKNILKPVEKTTGGGKYARKAKAVCCEMNNTLFSVGKHRKIYITLDPMSGFVEVRLKGAGVRSAYIVPAKQLYLWAVQVGEQERLNI